MQLTKAQQIGNSILELIKPYCYPDMAIVGGSVRRGIPEVKDIEIIAAPIKSFERGFPLYYWAVYQTGIKWIKPGTNLIEPWSIKKDAKYWRGLVTDDGEQIKIDIFFAEKRNWGVQSVFRTGPKDFNVAMNIVLGHTKFKLDEGCLRLRENNKVIPCESEEEFFANAGLHFVPLEKRGSADPISRIHKIR